MRLVLWQILMSVLWSLIGTYNTRVRLFPGNLLASALGYTNKAFFEAEAGASAVPKVKF